MIDILSPAEADSTPQSVPLNASALWRRYMIALALILGLILMSHVFSVSALKQSESDVASINESGRQRMLSQRILYTATQYKMTRDPVQRENLEMSIDRYERTHDGLARLARKSDTLEAIYFEGPNALDALSQIYIADARQVALAPDEAAVDFAELNRLGNGVLLQRLEQAVTGFETVAGSREHRLRGIQDLSLLAAVLIIFAEAFLIFWPSHKTVSRALSELDTENSKKQVALMRLTNFASIAADLFWETDLDGQVVYVAGRFETRIMGRREDMVGCNYLDLLAIDEASLEQMFKAIEKLEPYYGAQGTFTDRDGRVFHMELSGIPRFDENGRLAGYLGTADDVTRNIQERESVRQLALTDPLTGLANKRAFETDLRNALARRNSDKPLFLMAIDLDGFKGVNDTHGHGAGDEVLKIVAARMSAMTRSGDWAARVGGDEFFIVCANVPSREAVASLAKRLNDKLAEPYGLPSGVKVKIGASIGISCAPIDAADRALYAAKRSGRNTTRFARDVRNQDMPAIAS